MGFCTGCGNKIEENHRFCGACGTSVAPLFNPKVANIPEIQSEMTLPSEIKPKTDILYVAGDIDRKTLFDGCMLVLSSEDLILYTPDEKEELRRISISSIESCGYSTIRRGLMIKRRINEDSFQKILTQKYAELNDLTSKKSQYADQLRQTRVRAQRQYIQQKISEIEESLHYLSNEIRQLESDPAKIKITQEKTAEIQKEVFRLSKSFKENSNKTFRDEYKIWEYAINRRIKGLSKIKIETLPHDAILVINRRLFGTTPITIDEPLIDDAILEGKYTVTIFKEGYNPEIFKISADLSNEHIFEKIELASKDWPDHELDKKIERLRTCVPDTSIDVSLYDVEQEIEGEDEILLLTKDGILGVSKDKKQRLFEIPYGSINEARYDKGFLRRSKTVKINYNEKYFRNHEFDFWVDDNDGNISDSELKQRSLSLVEILNRKRKESKVVDIPNSTRSSDYFIVTEHDIRSNFRRFEPFEFEKLIAKLFEKKGYTTTVTQERADFGIDVMAKAGKETIAIQVKHWQSSVGGPDVHKTLGSMVTSGATRAMVVTSSDFTSQAYDIQKRGAPIELWNGSRLRDEFREYLLDAVNESRNSH